ncbi:MAG: NmrA family NAD(P)-binding protein [Bacteroidales bacterium]|nr:NmrA family NAD(P)-binding protein [Bacteroidales bacterium]MBN2820775.1 NmrA family NAD(P)-binding protein [Bacteroidales bacterium]
MLGSEICRILRKKCSHQSNGSRNFRPRKSKALKEAGVKIVIGDLRNKPSLRNAVKGVQAIIATTSSIPFS